VIISNAARIQWTTVLNGYGKLQLVYDRRADFDPARYAVDRRVDLWRRGSDGMSRLIDSYYLRALRRSVNETGDEQVVLTGLGRNSLLAGRIVDAAAGSTGAVKTGTIDDLMKAYVRENMGALAAAARDWSGNGLSVQADLSLGTSVTKSAPRHNLLSVLQSLSEESVTLDDPTYFDLCWITSTTMEFRTFQGQRGLDRRGTMTPFSLRRGTLTAAVLEEDATDEATYVYVAGQGQEELRSVVEVSDAARLALSPWGRREALADARHCRTGAALSDYADGALEEHGLQRRFQAVLEDRPGARFQVEWDLGDLIEAEYEDEVYDCEISAVTGTFGPDGERIVARLDYVE
jgi:hypothetical protein